MGNRAGMKSMIHPFALNLSKGKRGITTQPPNGDGKDEGLVSVRNGYCEIS